jgi:biotin transport system substrate-specific component
MDNALALRPTLADTLWPDAASTRLLRFALLPVMGSLALWAAAKVKVPFYPVPMTLQTLALMVLAAGYGSRLAVATVALYLLEGAMGLPVFANTPPQTAGIAYFAGSTGGFLAGFLAAAWIVGAAAERGFGRSPVTLAGAMLAAEAVLLLIGFGWLAQFLLHNPATALKILGTTGEIGWRDAAYAAWLAGVQPFVLGDLLKLALAACLIGVGWQVIGRRKA